MAVLSTNSLKGKKMEETFLIMTKKPVQGFPKGHLFDNITIGIKYSIRSHYMKSRQ